MSNELKQIERELACSTVQSELRAKQFSGAKQTEIPA